MPQASLKPSAQFVPPRINARIQGRANAGKERAIACGAILGEDAFHDEVMRNGGKAFVARMEKYGRTQEGKPLIIRRWFREICEAIGDFRIGTITSTGCSRAGKTMSNALCSIDQVVAGMMQIGFIYADLRSQSANSAAEWRPMADAWIKAIEQEVEATLRTRQDIATSATWSISNIAANFRYAGTQKGLTGGVGAAAMGTAATGYTAHVLYQDEMSQWAPGVSFKSRLNNSRFSTSPVRQIGTPGAGSGIEVYTRNIDHYFMPHYKCDSCGVEKPLDPFGCVLTPKVINAAGKQVESYLSQSNRPLDWWHTDPSSPIVSAVVCCSECGAPITEEQRTEGAWMRCRDTGLDLRDYLDSIDPEEPKTRKIALHFTPLCREGKPNIAQLIVEEGLNEERNAADWVQQDLGWPTEPRGEAITPNTLRPALGGLYPNPEIVAPRWTIAGIDCGRGEHWLWIMDVWPPKFWQKMSTAKVFSQSVRVVRFAADVAEPDIPELLERYGVNYGLIDNEPSRSGVATLCGKTVLEMADQKGRKSANYEKKEVKDGGVTHPCWFINSDFYKQSVVDSAIGLGDLSAWDSKPRYRFPKDWDRFYSTNGENSPIRHLCAVKFDPIQQKWLRPANSIDDLFFAAHFAEAALHIAIEHGVTDGDIEW